MANSFEIQDFKSWRFMDLRECLMKDFIGDSNRRLLRGSILRDIMTPTLF